MPRNTERNAEYMRNYRANKKREAAEKAAAGGAAQPAGRAEKAAASPARARTREATAPAVDTPPSEPAKTAPPKPPRRDRKHRAAVTRMLRNTGLNHVPEEAPLVEYLKLLADELDDDFNPKTRAQYLAALKDVRRVLAYNARPVSSPDPKPKPTPEEEAVEAPSTPAEPAPVNMLADFKLRHGIG